MADVNIPPSVPADVSVTDLGRLLGGEEITPAVPEAQPPAAPNPEVTPAAPAEPASTPEAAADKTPAAEPDKTTETEEKTVESPQETDKGEKKDKSWVDKRLSTLAHKRREAEDQARQERERAERLERELETLKANPGPKDPAAAPADARPAKPQLASFVAALNDGEPYELAVERYTNAVIESREAERETQRQVNAQAELQKTQQATFRKDWDQALEANPDFDDIVERVRSVAPDGLQVAMSQLREPDGTALWPAVTLYLDEHPQELEAISQQYATSQISAIASLGRIVATLKLSKAPQPQAPAAPRPPAAAAPKAPLPKPPAVVGGASAPAPVDLEKCDMDTFAREMPKYLPKGR